MCSALSPHNHHLHTSTDTATPASQLTSTQTLSELRTLLSSSLRQYPDFPSSGILFEDIFPLFTNPTIHRALLSAFILTITTSLPSPLHIDTIIGLDARGFLLAPSLALHFNCAFVPVRKPGKLPGLLETVEYKKEYGTDSFAIQKDGVKPGDKVLIVDDLIATGGSAKAAGELVRKCGGEVVGWVFLIELTKLGGRKELEEGKVFTVLESQAD
jgi:adenine phosphoribosyltransferase